MTLISRLEQAEAGSRELDAEITRILKPKWWAQLLHEAAMPCGAPEDLQALGAREFVRYRKQYWFTQSLDAAMSLVPEGCMWNLGGNPVGGFASAGLFGACIWQGIDQIHGEAPTPALALCIASLKAAGYE